MKKIGNSQPPIAEPSKKKKRQSSAHYTEKKRNPHLDYDAMKGGGDLGSRNGASVGSEVGLRHVE